MRTRNADREWLGRLVAAGEGAVLTSADLDVLRRTHERLVGREIYLACLATVEAAPIVDAYLAARKKLGDHVQRVRLERDDDLDHP